MIDQGAALRTAFRDVMAGVATPVSIVTALGPDGVPAGATVSAFSSLSMSPVMVLVALDAGSRTLAVIRESGHFGLNVLGAEHADLARTFAAGGHDRFSGVHWETDRGAPRIACAPAWISAAVADLVPAGDHVIVIGGVTNAEMTSAARPLVYYRRNFGTHLPYARTGNRLES